MSTLFDLTDRVAIVTGGGRGIGRDIARTLAGAGAHIVIAEFDPVTAQDAAAEIAGMGRESLAVHTDVRQSASVEAMAQQVVDRFGKIDILVNNAGIARWTPGESIPDDEWLEVMNVNLNGVYWACRSVGSRMLAQGKGAIVNIASMSGSIVNTPQPQAHYNTSKAGVIMLTKSLGAEWAQRGVRVNCVSPGYIDTEMSRGVTNKAWVDTWYAMIPMGRKGETADVAHAVWYLASDASAYATGTDLIIDGGYTSW